MHVSKAQINSVIMGMQVFFYVCNIILYYQTQIECLPYVLGTKMEVIALSLSISLYLYFITYLNCARLFRGMIE